MVRVETMFFQVLELDSIELLHKRSFMRAICKGLEKEKSKSFTTGNDLGHRPQRFERK